MSITVPSTKRPIYSYQLSTMSSDDDSSSSCSDGSSDNERQESGNSRVGKGTKRSRDAVRKSRDDEDSDSGSDSGDDSDGYDDDSNDSQDDSSNDGDDKGYDNLPIAERLERMEQQGVDLRHVRARRESAKQRTKQTLGSSKDSKTISRSAKLSDKSALTQKTKRSKHAPTEASYKRSDFYNQKPNLFNGLGVDLLAHRYKARDPRRSNLSAGAAVNVQQFDKNYTFLLEMRRNEIVKCKQQIAARQVAGRKGQQLRKKLGLTGSLEEDRATLKHLQQELADHERQQVKQAVQVRVKQKLVDERGSNYRPKRAELKQLELEARFDELKQRGGNRAVNQALEKKRKKNKSRDAARMGPKEQQQQY
ncbi:hypothetical protein MPSEU_000061400 [Mayamaea pseudoterrestris]|nr:hypothetical protein MPSEU_000061400 [Mayamaea pseudoterrestris]